MIARSVLSIRSGLCVMLAIAGPLCLVSGAVAQTGGAESASKPAAKAAAKPAAKPPAKRATPDVRSGAALVVDSESGEVLFERNASAPQPIASITKLMVAIVVLDAKQKLDEPIEITEDDKSKVKYSRSRLFVGTTATRGALLRVALAASDNRAAGALARSYPGGTDAALAAMNAKARALGLKDTQFDDPTGLSSGNVSTARDLVALIAAARRYPSIRADSTSTETVIQTPRGSVRFGNTNGLVRSDGWDVDLSKTGFIAEAGRCLTLHARIASRPVSMVFLDAAGKYTAIGDAHRMRQWLEPGYAPPRGAVAKK